MSDDDLTRLPESNSAKPAQVLSKGQVFGQYRVEDLVGRGGMGEVYAVTHTMLDTRHALKVIRPEILEHAEAPQRFRREAQVMAKLRHPNIIQVDDFGTTDDLTWLRMELLDGCASVCEGKSSLAEVLLSGVPLDPALVSDWLGQILQGLHYAHESGVVHRDLKPANLLINEDGHLKIADFGLVRLVGEDWLQSQVQETVARSIADPDVTRLEVEGESSKGTGTSALLGTFEFMSPEQKRGAEVDHRSDLYAIGLIAYRMLTGETTIGFDLPSDLVDGLDTSWDDWVRKATATKVERRFQSAAEMLDAQPKKRNLETGMDKTQGKVVDTEKDYKLDRNVVVDLDDAMRPDTLVSGSVTFSDGITMGWQLSASGQLGLIPGDDPDYRPSPEDIQSFQSQLVEVFRKNGY